MSYIYKYKTHLLLERVLWVIISEFSIKCRMKTAHKNCIRHLFKKHKASNKKYKPYILKYKALILKYMPCIFEDYILLKFRCLENEFRFKDFGFL